MPAPGGLQCIGFGIGECEGRAYQANGVADKGTMLVDSLGRDPEPCQIALAGLERRIGAAKRIDQKTFLDTVLADIMQRNPELDSLVQPSRKCLFALAASDLSAIAWILVTNPVVAVADIGYLILLGDRGQTGSFQTSGRRRQKDGRVVKRGKLVPVLQRYGPDIAPRLGCDQGKSAFVLPLERLLDQVPGKAGWHTGNLVGMRSEESDRFLGSIASKPDQIRRLPAPDEKAVGRVGRIRNAAQIDRDMGKLKRCGCRRECLDNFRMKPRRPSGRRETLSEGLPVDNSQSCG